MNWTKKMRRAAISSRLIDERIYAQALKEVEQGQRRDGLWAQALAKSEGSNKKAESLYIEYRANSIRDEMQIAEDTRTTQEMNFTNEPVVHQRITDVNLKSADATSNDVKVVSNGFYIGIMIATVIFPIIGIIMGFSYLRKTHPDARKAGKSWLIVGSAIILAQVVVLSMN